jgi:KDO2-lipid IV(A) lauroyltransferase
VPAGPPSAAPPRVPSAAHRVQYGALRTFIAGLGLLGAERAVRVGAAIGTLGFRPFHIRRTVVERQIAAAFPDLGPAAVRDVARRAYAHLGLVTVETALLSRMGPADVLAMVERADGWDIVERRIALGKGLIVVSGHLGNWELGAAYLAARGYQVDAVVRRMGNPLFDAYLTRARSRLGMTVVRDRDAVRRTPRTLRAGRAVGLLIDQAGLNTASTYVPFFGRPAKTPRGAAVFALRLDVPMVFGTALRQPGGRYRVFIEDVPVTSTGDLDHDVDVVVARYTEVLERHIRLAPDQYFWHHRRWKQQPSSTPSALRDPA